MPGDEKTVRFSIDETELKVKLSYAARQFLNLANKAENVVGAFAKIDSAGKLVEGRFTELTASGAKVERVYTSNITKTGELGNSLRKVSADAKIAWDSAGNAVERYSTKTSQAASRTTKAEEDVARVTSRTTRSISSSHRRRMYDWEKQLRTQDRAVRNAIIQSEREEAAERRRARAIDSVTAAINRSQFYWRTQADTLDRTTAALSRHNQEMHRVTLTWRTFLRLGVLNLASRSLYTFINLLRDGTNAAVEFQKAIAAIQTIDQRGLPFETWARGVRALSDAWGVDLIDQARAAYFTLSNQVAKGTESFQFLEEANRLAVTGLSTTEESVQLLTAGLNAFNLNITETRELAASMFKTVELGRLVISDMSDIFGRIAVPASQLGISYKELGAAISTATIQGVKMNEAGTLLRNVFLKLIRPTDAMKELFSDVGVSSGEALIQAYGLGGALAIIEERTQGLSSELGDLFGRIRAITGGMLFAGENLEKFNDALAQQEASIETYGDKAQLIFDTAAKQLEVQFNKVKNFFKRDVGETILNTLADLTNGFEGLVTAAKVFFEGLKTAIVGSLVFGLIYGFNKTATAIKALTFEFATLRLGVNTLTASVRTLGFALNALKSTGVFLVITAISFAIQRMATAAERTRQRIREAFEEWSEGYERTKNEQSNTYRQMVRESERVQREMIQTSTQHSAQIAAVYSSALKEVSKTIDEVEDQVKRANDSILDEVKDAISKLEQEHRKLVRSIETQQDALRSSMISGELDIFDLSIKNLDDPSQAAAIAQKIEDLLKRATAAADTGDIDLFEELFKQATTLSTRRTGILESIAEEYGLTLDVNTLIRERTQLLQFEQIQRAKIIEQLKEQKAENEKNYEIAELQRAQFERLLDQYKSFDFGELLALDDPDAIRRRFDEYTRIVDELDQKAKVHGIQFGGASFAELFTKRAEQVNLRIVELEQEQTQIAILKSQERVERARKEVAETKALYDNELDAYTRLQSQISIISNELGIRLRYNADVLGAFLDKNTKNTLENMYAIELLYAKIKEATPEKLGLLSAREREQFFSQLTREIQQMLSISDEATSREARRIRELFIDLQSTIRSDSPLITLADQINDLTEAQRLYLNTFENTETQANRAIESVKDLTNALKDLQNRLNISGGEGGTVGSTANESTEPAEVTINLNVNSSMTWDDVTNIVRDKLEDAARRGLVRGLA